VALARPLSDLPKFLTALAVGSKEAAAEASNAAALVQVRALRAELDSLLGSDRRLRSRATLGGRRTSTKVNFGYKEASADKAKFQPTAIVVGRGPVHILENPLGYKGGRRATPHTITLGVRRGPDGRVRDIVSPTAGDFRRRQAFGPQLRSAGVTSNTIRVRHPGVTRSSGPFRRGVAASAMDVERKWTKVFASESLRVKGF
jgi:hypothetical protein